MSSGSCVPGSGAADYANLISGASTACPLIAGDVLAVKTGTNTGPTATGLNARLSTWLSANQIVAADGSGGYIATTPGAPQLIRIPLVVDSATGASAWPSGSSTVTVDGMAWGVIVSCGQLANPSYCAPTDGSQVNILIVGLTGP
jgi:hypothetical protein